MKKLFLFLLIFLFNINTIKANEKISVTLSKCVDGDTAYFMVDNNEIKTRFLAIDTPESTNKIEPYGKEASKFTCSLLEEANKIEIEYDKNSDKTDKYDRHLVWVFIDDALLQDEIVKEGLAEVAYLYDDYKYTSILKDSEEKAKNKKINIWNTENVNVLNIEEDSKSKTNYFLIIILLFIFALILVFNKKERDKFIKKFKKTLKKEIKRQINI